MTDKSGYWKRQFNIWVLPIVLIGGVIAGHMFINLEPQSDPTSQDNDAASPDKSKVGERAARTPARKPVSTAPAKLVVDKFELQTEFNHPNLIFTLNTDLPTDARIIVSVSRAYTKVDSTNRFPIDYKFIRSTAGELRKPTKVEIDHSAWLRDLEKAKADASRLGLPIRVKAIEPDIEVSATLPINQPDPRFGDKNRYLTGTAVIAYSGGGKGVRTEVSIAAPVTTPTSATRRTPSFDPFNLDLNVGYVLAARVPVMPSPNPRDSMAAIRNMTHAPSGSIIRIETIRVISDVRWYRVTVRDRAGKSLANGWINSVALVGQSLRAL